MRHLRGNLLRVDFPIFRDASKTRKLNLDLALCHQSCIKCSCRERSVIFIISCRHVIKYYHVCLQAGNVACATSTGGITGKREGRVGDSPLVGSGGYADNNTGAVSTTGRSQMDSGIISLYDIRYIPLIIVIILIIKNQ